MAVVVSSPGVDGLSEVVAALREWQSESLADAQLHPGDLGWFWRFGAAATAAAVRVWRRDGQVVAVGLLDEPDVLRLAIAPDRWWDDEVTRRLVDDVTRPKRGVLVAGKAAVSAASEALIQEFLDGEGWLPGEPWTPLHRDLTDPVPDPGIRVEVTGAAQVPDRAAVQRASFDRSTFVDERWHDMAAGLPYADGRCLVAYDGDTAVATVTVWSAGPGKPGLLEPLGVHRDHRGQGHGTAISLAAAAALRELGSSSAVVCTPSSNAAAVATYESAGFTRRRVVRDLCRQASRLDSATPPAATETTT